MNDHGRSRFIALFLATLLFLALLPAASAAEEGGLSGEYVAENSKGEVLTRVGWEISADGKALTLTHLYSAPTVEYGVRCCAGEIAIEIAKLTGKTAKEVQDGVESLKLVGFTEADYELYVFQYLREIDLGSVGAIDNWAFNGLPIETITIPGTVKTLGSFGDCKALRSVVIEEGVEQISFGAFKDCESLTDVSIPNSVKRIGLNAFQNTPWLNSQTDEFVTVGDGVLIRYNGTGKTTLTIPAGIKSVCCTLGFTHEFQRLGNDTDDSANMTNPDLETVVFGPDVKEIYGACYGLRKLHSAVLQEGVESIGEYSFFQCDSLQEITLPESLRYLFWKQTFGTFRTDPEGFAGELYEEDGVDSSYPYGPTPTVTFLGAPPTVHPDEKFYEEFHVMWDGDGQALTELAYDLSPGVIWHLRYSLKYADEWETFDPGGKWGHYMVWIPRDIPFAVQYDAQPFYRKGDANLDGEVTAADAVLILRYVVDIETLSDIAKMLADVNGDGKITAADAAMILRYIVGLTAALS